MKTYVDYVDIEHMEQAASCLRDRLLIRLLSRLGCRISEALSIKVQDIDFERKTITILHLKRNIRLCCLNCGARLGRRHQFCPGCGTVIGEAIKSQQERRRIRVLPIDDGTVDMIRRYLSLNKLHEDNGLAPLFCLNRHRAWQIVRQCAQQAGVPDLVNPETGRVRGVSPHSLRDAFSVHAMKLDDSGDALRLLQQHLGHASFDTTARYRKIAGEEHREWYDRLWNESRQSF
jgi:integrase/recombinase XerD